MEFLDLLDGEFAIFGLAAYVPLLVLFEPRAEEPAYQHIVID
jgi:hypothetical protein